MALGGFVVHRQGHTAQAFNQRGRTSAALFHYTNHIDVAPSVVKAQLSLCYDHWIRMG